MPAAVALIVVAAASACSDPGSGTEPIAAELDAQSAGTVAVPAEDTNPEPTDAVESQESNDADPSGAEFIDLPYFETSSGTAALGACDSSDSEVTVCDLEYRGELDSTLIGYSTEVLRGTVRLYPAGSCELRDGQSGTRTSTRFDDATMFTQDGSEIYFRATNDGCIGPESGETYGFWEIDGGTGRFEDASGLMSTVGGPDLTHSAGTIRVRADLWESALPATSSSALTSE